MYVYEGVYILCVCLCVLRKSEVKLGALSFINFFNWILMYTLEIYIYSSRL